MSAADNSEHIELQLPYAEQWLKTAALGLILAALLALAYWLTVFATAPDYTKALQTADQLSAENQSLRDQNQGLQTLTDMLGQDLHVMREANNILKNSEAERQAELAQLQADLEFYRRLAGTGGSLPGLAAHDLQIFSTTSERVFGYRLTLTQNLKNAKIIRGKVVISLSGISDNQPLELIWEQLQVDAAAVPEFEFKYFQQLSGFLTLPADFTPHQIKVKIDPTGSQQEVERTFPWPIAETKFGEP